MRLIGFLIFALFSSSAFAYPLELVITPTRSETPVDQVGSSVTVITADEIKRQQKQSVSDILSEVPGIEVAQNGGVGQTTSVFMRGAPSEHTLVLVDGVEVNDPSSTAGNYDFSTLTTDNIEKIEVLRGNQSTLYGSNAIGGVISITTKRGAGRPSTWASVEGGSYDTYKGASGISGTVDNMGFNLNASRFSTGGFPNLDKKFGGAGNDGSDASNFGGRLDDKINDIFSAYTTLRYDNTRAQFDEFGANANDDTHAKEFSWRGAGKAVLFDGKWDQEVGVSYYNLDRDTTGASFGATFYHGDRTQFDWLNHVKVNDNNLLTFGAETRYETANSSYTTGVNDDRINGYYAQDQIGITKQFYTTLGGRIDQNSEFGIAKTYRIAPVYTIAATNTRLKASYGTGFKAPSLFQLFSSFGDPSLKPETSKGYDFGFEQPLMDNRLQFGSTFFHTIITDLIDFDTSTSKYLNVGAARINGVENFVTWSPIASLMLKAQYTYTGAYDAGTGDALLRRAKNSVSFEADYTFMERGRAGINATYKGTRDDVDFNYNTVEMPGYMVVNLTGSWQLNDTFLFYGRIDNLLDKQYENLYGYGTAGLSAYAGIKAQY